MDKMKRVFSFLLAFVITLGAFSSFGYVALADEAEEVKPVEEVATEFLDKVPADVKGTDYEKAVRRLVAFGIVEGFPDGTFKPENELTRAEFSKMVVIALGLEDAAKAMENKKTEFGDVYVGHWAQGYINVASSQGLIKGYEDGTFRPSNQVTYAEAVTILVRALGYQDSFLYGKWPANYISKAADLGISGPVEIPNYDNNAIRGNVARLLEETLGKETIHVVQYEGTAITYEPSGKLLREEKLGIKSDAGRLVGDMYVDKDLKANEVRVYTKDGKDSKVVDMGNAAGDYREFIGEKVTMFTKGKKVLLVENDKDVNAEFDFVTDAFPEREGITVELAGHNGRYGLADDAYFYVMKKEGDTYQKYSGKDKIEAKIANSLPGRVGKVVVENGEIVYGEIMSDKLVAEDFMVVKEVKEDAIVGISPLRGDHKISFSDKSKYKEVHVFDQNGKKLEVKDIEAGDVVYAQKQYFDKKDSLFIVAVQDNNVTGDLGRTTKDRVEIDGEYENVAIHRDGTVARVSMDLLETSDMYTRDRAAELHKEDVIAYRGAGNLVVMLSANDELAGYKHGVVTRIWPKDGEIEISVDLDGKGMDRVRFDVEDEDDLYDFKYMNEEGKLVDAKVEDILGQPVAFRLSGEKIAKGSLRLIGEEDKLTVNKDDGTLVFGPSSFYLIEDSKVNGKKDTKGFKVTSNAKVIEAYGLDSKFLYEAGSMDKRDDVKAITKASDDFVMYDYEEIANTKFEGKEDFDFGVILNRLGEVETVVIYDKDAEMLKDADAHESIIVTELGKRGDDFDAKYHSYQSGLKTDKGTNIGSKVEAGELAIIEINRRGRVSVLDKDAETDFYNGVTEDATVADVSRNNDTITVGKTDYEIAHDAVVYKNDGRDLEQVEYTEIAIGDTVDFIATKADVIEVLVINEEAKGSEDKDEAKLVKDRLYRVEGTFTRRGVDYVELYDTEAGKSLAPVEYADNAFGEKDKEPAIGMVGTVDFRKIDGEEVITKFNHAEIEIDEKATEAKLEVEGKEVVLSGVEFKGLAKDDEITAKDIKGIKIDDKDDDEITIDEKGNIKFELETITEEDAKDGLTVEISVNKKGYKAEVKDSKIVPFEVEVKAEDITFAEIDFDVENTKVDAEADNESAKVKFEAAEGVTLTLLNEDGEEVKDKFEEKELTLDQDDLKGLTADNHVEVKVTVQAEADGYKTTTKTFTITVNGVKGE